MPGSLNTRLKPGEMGKGKSPRALRGFEDLPTRTGSSGKHHRSYPACGQVARLASSSTLPTRAAMLTHQAIGAKDLSRDRGFALFQVW